MQGYTHDAGKMKNPDTSNLTFLREYCEQNGALLISPDTDPDTLEYLLQVDGNCLSIEKLGSRLYRLPSSFQRVPKKSNKLE